MCFGGRITTDISGSDDHNPFSNLYLIQFAPAEEFQGRDHFFLARNRQNAGLLRTHGNDDEIIVRLDLFQVPRCQFLLQVEVRESVLHPAQFSVHNVVRNPGPGNESRNFSPQSLAHVIQDRFMASPAQLPGNGNTRRPGPDHSHTLPCERREFGSLGFDARFTQLRHIHRQHVDEMPGASLHAMDAGNGV